MFVSLMWVTRCYNVCVIYYYPFWVTIFTCLFVTTSTFASAVAPPRCLLVKVFVKVSAKVCAKGVHTSVRKRVRNGARKYVRIGYSK